MTENSDAVKRLLSDLVQFFDPLALDEIDDRETLSEGEIIPILVLFDLAILALVIVAE